MLADYRTSTGFTLRELARLIGYSYSFIANAEKGRDRPEEAFWARADEAVGAGGALAARDSKVRDLERAARERARQMERTARLERASGASADGPVQPDTPLVSGQAAIVVCPNCHESFELIPRSAVRKETGPAPR